MRLRRLAVALAIAVVAPLLTVALAGPGGAQVNCGNDTWFDGQGWRDNPKIKSACDTTGTHVHVVQHFSFGAGYNGGGLDGDWGPNTQTGISDHKTNECTIGSTSGNVGSDAWECYRDNLSHVTGTNKYDIPGLNLDEVNDEEMSTQTISGKLYWWAGLLCPAPDYFEWEKATSTEWFSNCL